MLLMRLLELLQNKRLLLSESYQESLSTEEVLQAVAAGVLK